MSNFSENDVHEYLYASGLETVIVDCPEFGTPEGDPISVIDQCSDEYDFQLWRIIKDRAGPIWSKKMNGPTICRSGDGKARRTSKPPMSRARGMISVSMLLASDMGHSGFCVGFQLM